MQGTSEPGQSLIKSTGNSNKYFLLYNTDARQRELEAYDIPLLYVGLASDIDSVSICKCFNLSLLLDINEMILL